MAWSLWWPALIQEPSRAHPESPQENQSHSYLLGYCQGFRNPVSGTRDRDQLYIYIYDLWSVVHMTHLWAVQRWDYFCHFTDKITRSFADCYIILSGFIEALPSFTQWLWVIYSIIRISLRNCIENISPWRRQKNPGRHSPQSCLQV